MAKRRQSRRARAQASVVPCVVSLAAERWAAMDDGSTHLHRPGRDRRLGGGVEGDEEGHGGGRGHHVSPAGGHLDRSHVLARLVRVGPDEVKREAADLPPEPCHFFRGCVCVWVAVHAGQQEEPQGQREHRWEAAGGRREAGGGRWQAAGGSSGSVDRWLVKGPGRLWLAGDGWPRAATHSPEAR